MDLDMKEITYAFAGLVLNFETLNNRMILDAYDTMDRLNSLR